MTVYSSTSASGGRAVRLWQNATLTKTVTLPAATTLTVRAMGDQCSGAPTMVVRVDGAQVMSASVAATTFTDYAATVAIPAGQHTVEVAFTNDHYGGTSCDRNLHIDKVTFSA